MQVLGEAVEVHEPENGTLPVTLPVDDGLPASVADDESDGDNVVVTVDSGETLLDRAALYDGVTDSVCDRVDDCEKVGLTIADIDTDGDTEPENVLVVGPLTEHV